MSKEKQIDETIEYLNNAINVERNSYFGKGCITMPLIEADKILDILQGYRKQSEWISVDERLPDEQGHFLIVDKEGQMNTAFYTPRFGWFSHFRIRNITHWMPLPEPPKMRKEDEGK